MCGKVRRIYLINYLILNRAREVICAISHICYRKFPRCHRLGFKWWLCRIWYLSNGIKQMLIVCMCVYLCFYVHNRVWWRELNPILFNLYHLWKTKNPKSFYCIIRDRKAVFSICWDLSWILVSRFKFLEHIGF